jgi:hypothetical protein
MFFDFECFSREKEILDFFRELLKHLVGEKSFLLFVGDSEQIEDKRSKRLILYCFGELSQSL